MDTATTLVCCADRLLDAAAASDGFCIAIRCARGRSRAVGWALATPALSFDSRCVALRRPFSRGQRPAAWPRPRTPYAQEQLFLDGPIQIAVFRLLRMSHS